MLQLFVLIAVISTPVASQCSSKNIESKIELRGQPVNDITIKWHTVNQHPSSEPVTYNVYFNKTSRFNKCNCETKNLLYNAVHCNQQSSTPGHTLSCTLKEEEIAKTNIDFIRMGSICIMIEANSTNDTWYSFNECRSPYSENKYCHTICPAPENVRLTALSKRSLNVKWDASSSLNEKAIKHIFSFSIYFRRRDSFEKANVSGKFKKVLDTQNRKLTMQDNMYNIVGLEPSTYYDVKIYCCNFFKAPCQFFSKYIGRTLEEEPSRAPIITHYEMYAQKLLFLIKWKLPDILTWRGRIVRFEVSVWKSKNCTEVSYKSLIQKNITTNGTQVSVHEEYQATIILDESTVYCGHVRICTVPGCGPWSGLFSTRDDVSYQSPNSIPMQGSKVIRSAIIFGGISAVGVIILVMVAVALLRQNSRQQRQRPLNEEVGDVDVASSTDTDEASDNEANHQYATPNEMRLLELIPPLPSQEE